jgi:hypothetical protein
LTLFTLQTQSIINKLLSIAYFSPAAIEKQLGYEFGQKIMEFIRQILIHAKKYIDMREPLLFAQPQNIDRMHAYICKTKVKFLRRQKVLILIQIWMNLLKKKSKDAREYFILF